MARTYRDAYGVPHVRAGSVLDLAHAQGAVTAHDRGFQLEWLRRRALGTTAEVVGTGGEPWDRFAVRVRIAETAQRAYAGLSAAAQAFVTAYVDGLNAHRRSDVPELRAVGLEAGEWPAWMPLATFHAQQVMFADIGSHLWERRARQVLGDLAPLSHEGPLAAGSNAWAVGGARTVSGRPMIGGDPHRTFESPGVYHQVRLVCENPEDAFDVVGFSFAGVPGVQHFAHAGEVAWAITNAMADYQDLDEVGPDHEGPTVLPGVGFRGPSTVLGELGFEALLPLLRARTTDDVDRAFDHWVEPVNNVVIADVHGTVRYRWAGRVPVRDERREWTGWRTDPHRVDVGPHGAVVTANDRRGPESDEVGVDFAPAHRADRLRTMLGDRHDLTPADFEAMHNDTVNGQVEALRELLPARLRDWDGRMEADSAEAADFAAWRSALVRRIAADPVFAPLHEPAPDPLFAPYFVIEVTIGLALPALLAAGTPYGIDLEALARAAETDVGSPPVTWGDTHRFSAYHPFDLSSDLEPPEVPAVALSGDQDCVRCVGSLPAVSDVGYRGSVARYVWDLADRTAGGWVVPMGTSGDPRSPHHLDQLEPWAAGRLLPIVTDWDELSEVTLGRGGA